MTLHDLNLARAVKLADNIDVALTAVETMIKDRDADATSLHESAVTLHAVRSAILAAARDEVPHLQSFLFLMTNTTTIAGQVPVEARKHFAAAQKAAA